MARSAQAFNQQRCRSGSTACHVTGTTWLTRATCAQLQPNSLSCSVPFVSAQTVKTKTSASLETASEVGESSRVKSTEVSRIGYPYSQTPWHISGSPNFRFAHFLYPHYHRSISRLTQVRQLCTELEIPVGKLFPCGHGTQHKDAIWHIMAATLLPVQIPPGPCASGLRRGHFRFRWAALRGELGGDDADADAALVRHHGRPHSPLVRLRIVHLQIQL